MKENSNMQSDFCPVIDTHCHIFPDKIAEKATTNIGRFYNLPMYTNGNLSQLYAVRSCNLCSDGERRIVKQVIFSPATAPSQTESINNFIADLCKKDDSFIGFGTIHPDDEDYESEIARIKQLGLVGIKFHSDFQQFNLDDPKAIKIYKSAAREKLPVIFHMGDEKLDYSSAVRLKNVMEQVPELIIIAAHMGGYCHWKEAYDILVPSENLYFDISSCLSFVSVEEVKRMLAKFGSSHFFFGSDFPMWNSQEELVKLEKLKLDNKLRRDIEYNNFVSFMERLT